MNYLTRLANAFKGVNRPQNNKTSTEYVYRPEVDSINFEDGIAALKKSGWRVVNSGIDNTSPAIVLDILNLARKEGINFVDYEINIDKYNNYFNEAEYKIRYPDYYLGNQIEKSLEHYLALSLLNLSEEDVFIDLASEHSPIPEIYARLTGATTYSQDIMYPPGINGNRIGGDACSMPVPEGFASKATLTCSIEHFEGDADTSLFHELSRILKPGGMVCVVPFYIFKEQATQTDPTVSVPSGVDFDRGTTIYCAQGWGNRHGRFYSPKSLLERLIKPVQDKFKFEFYYLKNAAEVDPSVYVRFAFTATRL
ncbi:MAG: class I SAM-dependent methyltransferase [Potamolinea sp.]